MIKIPNNANIANVLKKATPYLMVVLPLVVYWVMDTSFVIRDAHGIRPAYYYIDDEVIVAASERAAIRTTFNVGENEVHELMPGNALIVDNDGNYQLNKYLNQKKESLQFRKNLF